MDDDKILNTIPNTPIPYLKLAKLCNINFNQNNEFTKTLFRLIDQNKIAKTRNAEYFRLEFINSGEGKFLANPKGFGFVDIIKNDKKESVFFSPISKKNAIDGDLIKYGIYIDPINKKEIGVVTKIVSRNTSIVGLIKRNGDYLDLYPLNHNLGNRIKILNKQMVKKDHLVLGEIVKVTHRYILVKITKDLGHKDDKYTDIKSMIISSGVHYEFSKQLTTEVDAISDTISENDIKGRKDLRDIFTITIDGFDSKDFDDAISVQKNDDDYSLYIHIADVSHYVKKDSILDKEALERGTSIYLPGNVIPMLPRRLSDNICSLNPNLDRLTITCQMKIDFNGNILETLIYPSIINSNNRMVYGDVNNFLKNKYEIKEAQLSTLLTNAHLLSKILIKKNQENGYIDFQIEESKIILDDNGKPSEIRILKQDIAEKIIESFMVLANQEVAKKIESMKLPFIYRIHDKPSVDNLKALKKIMYSMNIHFNIKDNPTSKDFADSIKNIDDYKYDNFIKTILLRTMSKAIYKKDNVGHFGLALKSYTHFTSPIRRYPDLMVHRMLREYLFSNEEVDKNKFKNQLDKITLENSNSEAIATNLERQVVDFKKAEYYERFIGTVKKAQIVSINKFGMFVEFHDKVTGLIKIDTIKNFISVSSDKLKLISKDKTYKLGEFIDVKIISIDKFSGKINLNIS